MRVGDLRVWWCPQVPMSVKDHFIMEVRSVRDAALILKTLANYDLYQLEKNIKPDFSNAGGLLEFVEDGDGEGVPGWNDWCDEATGIEDPEEYIEYLDKRPSA